MNVLTLIAGLVGMVLIVVFLGNYAVSIGTIPLWLIIVGVLLMPIIDYIQSVLRKSP